MTKSAFDQVDTNGDGVMTVQEAGVILRDNLPRVIDQFKFCDWNRDETVTEDEGKDCFIKRLGRSDESLEVQQKFFSESDADGNGSIDLKEAEAWYASVGNK